MRQMEIFQNVKFIRFKKKSRVIILSIDSYHCFDYGALAQPILGWALFMFVGRNGSILIVTRFRPALRS